MKPPPKIRTPEAKVNSGPHSSSPAKFTRKQKAS